MAGRLNTRMKLKRAAKAVNEKMNLKLDDEYDASVLQKPLTTNVNGLVKALKLFQNATDEVREYLTSECDILYECLVCRSIFRSLFNFILHKRVYCQEKCNSVTCPKWSKNDDDYLEIIQKDSQDVSKDKQQETDNKKTQKKNLNSIIEGLTQRKQFGFEMENFSIGDFYEEMNNKSNEDEKNNDTKLDLENIEGSNCGVFQTLRVPQNPENRVEEMKQEVFEIHSILEGQSAVLGPEGKVLNMNPKQKNGKLVCEKCNIHFSTRKTYISHLKYKHENSRQVYPCLECTDTFATIWSVYRHLYKIHRKTLTEVRKMRPQIQAKAFKRSEVSLNQESVTADSSASLNDQQKIDEENQAWMDNFESDNDIQMCGGCGRRFERRAALNSHSQTCQKRIAARNLINVNRQKRIAATEDKQLEKRNTKMMKLDLEADKKLFDKEKTSVVHTNKKRKIGIQIRYDYNKSNIEKNRALPIQTSNISDEIQNTSSEKENLTFKENNTEFNTDTSKDDLSKKSPNNAFNSRTSDESNSNLLSNSEIMYSMITAKTEKDISSISCKTEYNLEESEIVSIPSSNSSPNKEEQDPLCLKDMENDTDSEIEEIFGPCSLTNIFDEKVQSSVIKPRTETSTHDKELSSVNENTLKLIKLINSDIPDEDIKPTLDSKMSLHVNLKKLQCVPCDMKFTNMSKLRFHMAQHFNWNRFRCDICSFKAYEKSNVFEHIKSSHNIQDSEKIEAVILQIPDWETIEFASKEFRIIGTDLVLIRQNKTDIKNNAESSKSVTPESCAANELIESGSGKGPKGRNRTGRKSKVITSRTNSKEDLDDDNTKEPIPEKHLEENIPSDNNCPGNSSSPTNVEMSNSNTSSQQQLALKKMVYEVIFGQDTIPTKSTISLPSTSDKETTAQTTTTTTLQTTSTTTLQTTSTNKSSVFHSIDNRSSDVTVADPNTFVNNEEDDDDIYIVENEELVAVK